MKANKSFIEAMRRATQLVRAGGPVAATRFIQGLLRPERRSTGNEQPAPAAYDVDIDSLVNPVSPGPHAPASPTSLPDASGEFLAQRFSGHAGSRNYKLYVPSGDTSAPLPLLVMLHGCTQNPDDFATGTRANRWAQSRRCLVVYPQQIQRANSHRCWNWFRPLDQQAGRGEPAIIAGIVKQVIDEYRVDTRRVYVAGLSAGGAMAAIVAREYPDLFAAAAVHSGLPAGAAHDVTSALTVMKTGRPKFASTGATRAIRRFVPVIALHGDADSTVNPANSDWLIDSAVDMHRMLNPDSPLHKTAQTINATDASRAVQRTRYLAPGGASIIEHWVVRGAAHAWSGGDAAGSYADARGPDATAAILDFFAQHAMPASIATPQVMDSTAPA
ncbi:MAG TPA: PHB depolymerase family esterase [Burkholderiaceae bacterium]|nr:PHB depolymerase family esterase [Burkholderiaceae bacterium]